VSTGISTVHKLLESSTDICPFIDNLKGQIWSWANDIYDFPRSLTGTGVRQTLSYFSSILPNLTSHSVPSGYKAYDWSVPDEWHLRRGWIKNMRGELIISYPDNPLSILGYSEPIHKIITRDELLQHVISKETLPSATPYATSYYERTWGFCIPYDLLQTINDNYYEVYIDSDLFPGVLDYADLIIPGALTDEILFSTYICHPAMANNEISGPVVQLALASCVSMIPSPRYTYRFVFVPETLGSLVYLSKNLNQLQDNVRAGYILTCLGDSGNFSYIPSRHGNTLSDRVAKKLLSDFDSNAKFYTWLDRGSDERQYCSPNIDLPVCSVTRSKYGEYKEYHTSFDNLTFINPESLFSSLLFYLNIILAHENNGFFKCTTLGEPQLSKYNLYPTLSTGKVHCDSQDLLDLISLCDGTVDLLEISTVLSIPMNRIYKLVNQLLSVNLLTPIS
jgi:aminopeptidase-like protein